MIMQVVTGTDCGPGKFLRELQPETRKHAETLPPLGGMPAKPMQVVALHDVSIGELAHAIRFSGLWLRDAPGGWTLYRAESLRVAPQEVRDGPFVRRTDNDDTV